MIRVVILETDRMVCKILCDILQKMKGFQIVGTITDVEKLSEYKVDLIIGEITGVEEKLQEWIQKQRVRNRAIDLIPVTSTCEYSVYRRYADIGVIDYILKPFEPGRVKRALMRYYEWKQKLVPDAELRQAQIDAFYYPGSMQEEQAISPHTYNRIQKYIQIRREGWFTAKEAAMEMKISVVTMRRYLEYMHQQGYLKIQPQYGKKGRPVYEYCVRNKEDAGNGYNDCSNEE